MMINDNNNNNNERVLDSNDSVTLEGAESQVEEPKTE